MIIAANWKMNKTRGEAAAWVADLLESMGDLSPAVRLRVYPPFFAVEAVARAARGSRLEVGAQNLHYAGAGAFTGEVSAGMVLDAGADWVLVGHSERRTIFGEDDALLARKVGAALAAGLRPLFCIGESLAEREAGETDAVLARQIEQGLGGLDARDLDRLEVAYEPVWAIGTGRVATAAQVESAHRTVRDRLVERFGEPGRAVPILYGGSVKADNAGEILGLRGVDGVLVGGASLTVGGFLGIARAGRN